MRRLQRSAVDQLRQEYALRASAESTVQAGLRGSGCRYRYRLSSSSRTEYGDCALCSVAGCACCRTIRFIPLVPFRFRLRVWLKYEIEMYDLREFQGTGVALTRRTTSTKHDTLTPRYTHRPTSQTARAHCSSLSERVSDTHPVTPEPSVTITPAPPFPLLLTNRWSRSCAPVG
jgi:hypothetical protein